MKFLLISAIVAAAATASAATMLRSHTSPVAAGAMSLQDIHAAANVNKLPVENFEDRFESWSAVNK